MNLTRELWTLPAVLMNVQHRFLYYKGWRFICNCLFPKFDSININARSWLATARFFLGQSFLLVNINEYVLSLIMSFFLESIINFLSKENVFDIFI